MYFSNPFRSWRTLALAVRGRVFDQAMCSGFVSVMRIVCDRRRRYVNGEPPSTYPPPPPLFVPLESRPPAAAPCSEVIRMRRGGQ